MKKDKVMTNQMEFPLEGAEGEQIRLYLDDVVPFLQQQGVEVTNHGGAPLIKADNMYESLRYAEYEITSGIGEIVDNAIEAEANNVRIYTKTKTTPSPNKKGRSTEVMEEIAVIDDGIGMSYEYVRRCLVLGESIRPVKKGGLGIGRFGVGLTLGGISLARKLEIYSRNTKDGNFNYTYLDLDVIKDPTKAYIPDPVEKEPPFEYLKHLQGSTGTIIILSKCDRLQYDEINDKLIAANNQIAGLSNYLGRTFRKFIYAGRNIYLNEEKVHLHDPLFILGPTRFELENAEDDPKVKMKAKRWGKTKSIPVEILGKPGEYANVDITLTLLPKEWRIRDHSGGSKFAKERRLDDNEGVSILRANREVLYATVPYIIGQRGQSRFLDIDRWWGCEISFPPELDNYFTVKYIKRGAEPVKALRDKIRTEIWPSIKAMREEIQADRREEKSKDAKKSGVFAGAEDAMAEADKTMAKGKRGSNVSSEETEKELGKLAQTATKAGLDSKSMEEKKKELEEKPYSIVPVDYPESIFFETKHLLDHIVVKLNINHPFYKEVFAPLCGSVETMDEDSDIYEGAETIEQQKIRRAFMLMLLSYAKAESFFEDNDVVLNQLRSHWGMSLGVAINGIAAKE